MILPNGAFCLIKERAVDADGNLLLIVHSWDSESHHGAAPAAPHSIQHHGFGPWKDYKQRPGVAHLCLDGTSRPVTQSDDVGSLIAKALEKCHAPGTRQRESSAHIVRGNEDRWGFLSHPHVVALEVSP